jgi:hypothetical protein
MSNKERQGSIANALLPAVPVEIPYDADNNRLYEGDRVYSHDVADDGGYVRCYGTLMKSEEPETYGHWCVEYDDGECFMVLGWGDVWSAVKA